MIEIMATCDICHRMLPAKKAEDGKWVTVVPLLMSPPPGLVAHKVVCAECYEQWGQWVRDYQRIQAQVVALKGQGA